ncbi:MAG: NAD(P)H-dependent oxidoreductase subunit E [Solirubrobacterales bacterium]
MSPEDREHNEAEESAEETQSPGESGESPVPEEGAPPEDHEGETTESGEEHADTGDAEGAGDAEGSADAGAEAVGGAAYGEDDPVQIPEPHETGISEEFEREITEIVGRYPEKRSASLPALFAVQKRYGWCTPEGIRQAAAVMGVTPAYLEGVGSFYDLLHMEPAGDHRVLVCTNISCWMRGGDELLQSFCEAAGASYEDADHGGVVNGRGDIFVSGFECLGACDLAPMASIDERYFGPLEQADAQTAIDQLRASEEVLPDRALYKRLAAGGPEPDPDPRVARVEGE